MESLGELLLSFVFINLHFVQEIFEFEDESFLELQSESCVTIPAIVVFRNSSSPQLLSGSLEFLHEFFGPLGHVVALKLVSQFLQLAIQEVNLRGLNLGQLLPRINSYYFREICVVLPYR